MPSINVSDLVTRAQLAADMEGTFISSAGWLYYANTEYKNLYMRIARMGWPLETTSTTITLTGAASYTVTAPAAVVSLKIVDSSSRLKRIPMKSEISQKWVTPKSGETPKEAIIIKSGDNLTIQFNPSPASGTVYMKGVANPLILVTSGATPGTSSTTITMPLGWEERIVLGMARKALAKEETINPAIERDIEEMDAVIENSAQSFILTEANTVVDMNEVNDSDYSNWFWL